MSIRGRNSRYWKKQFDATRGTCPGVRDKGITMAPKNPLHHSIPSHTSPWYPPTLVSRYSRNEPRFCCSMRIALEILAPPSYGAFLWLRSIACPETMFPSTREDRRRDNKACRETVWLDGRMEGPHGATTAVRGRLKPCLGGNAGINNGDQRGSFDIFSSPSFQLQQHIDRFTRGHGTSVADGRHLVHLLQLELRDAVRRGTEAEVEVSQLRERLKRINSSRIEKEVIDRQSFAGIALAHADASVELRNRLESAQAALQQSQAEKGALKEDLLSKADTIAQLERHVAELTTTVDFGREAQMHDTRKALEEDQRKAVEQINNIWRQRLATVERAYATALRRWEAGEAPAPSEARDQQAALVRPEALCQSCGNEEGPRRLADTPSRRSTVEQPPSSVSNDHIERCPDLSANNLHVKVCQSSSPVLCHHSDAYARDDGPIPGAPKPPMALHNPSEMGLAAPQPFQPSTPQVDRGRCSPLRGLPKEQSGITRSAWAATRPPSAEEPSEFESVSQPVSGPLAANKPVSPSTERPESVSNFTSECKMPGHGSRGYSQGPKLNETLLTSSYDHQGHAHEVKSHDKLGSIIGNKAVVLGSPDERCAIEGRDKSGSPVRVGRRAPDAINPVTNPAGESRSISNEIDVDAVNAATVETEESRVADLCSSPGNAQQQHYHQKYESCVSIPSWEPASQDEEQEGPPASTSSNFTSATSTETVSRSSGRRSGGEEVLSSAELESEDLHHGADTVGNSSSDTKRLSQSLSRVSSSLSPDVATSGCTHPASSIIYGSGSASALGSCSSSNYSSQTRPTSGDSRTASVSDVSTKSEACSALESAFEVKIDRTSSSCRGSSWSQRHSSSRGTSRSCGVCNGSSRMELANHDRASVYSNRQTSRSDDGQQALSTPSGLSTGSRLSSVVTQSFDGEFGRAASSSVREGSTRRSEMSLDTPRPPTPSWSSQSSVQQSGTLLETRHCSNPRGSSRSTSQPRSHSSYRSGSGGTQSSGGGVSNSVSWSTDLVSETYPSTHTRNSEGESLVSSISLEGRHMPRDGAPRGHIRPVFGSSETMESRSQSSVQHPGPQQCFLIAEDSRQSIFRSEFHSRSASSGDSSTRSGSPSVTTVSTTRRLSRQLTGSVRSSSSISSSPVPDDEISRGGVERGPCPQDRSSPPISAPLMNTSDTRHIIRYVERAQRGDGRADHERAPVERSDSRQAVLPKSAHLGWRGRGSGHTYATTPSQPLKSPTSIETTMAAGAQISTTAAVQASGNAVIFEVRSFLSDSLGPTDRHRMDVATDQSQPSSTISSSRESRGDENNTCASTRSKQGLKSHLFSGGFSANGGSSEGSRPSRDSATGNGSTIGSASSDSISTGSFQSGSRTVSRLHGDGVDLDHSAQLGTSGGTTTYSLSHREAGSSAGSCSAPSLNSTAGVQPVGEARPQRWPASRTSLTGSEGDEVGQSQPSTIASSSESHGNITSASSRRNERFRSQPYPQEFSVSRDSSKGSRLNRDSATGNGSTNGSASSDSISNGSFQSGSRTVSRLHGDGVDLDHSAQLGTSGGTTTYSLSHREAGSSAGSCSAPSLNSTAGVQPVGEARPQRWPASRTSLTGSEGDEVGQSQPSTIASSSESHGNITSASSRRNERFRSQSYPQEFSVSRDSSEGSRPNRDGVTGNGSTNGSASSDIISTGSFQSGSRTVSRLHGDTVDLDHSARLGTSGGTTTFSLSHREAGSSTSSCSAPSLNFSSIPRGVRPVEEARPQRWPPSRTSLTGSEGDGVGQSQPSTIASSSESHGDISSASTRSNEGFRSQSYPQEFSVSRDSSKGSRLNRDGVTENRRGGSAIESVSSYNSISVGSFQSGPRTASLIHSGRVDMDHSSRREPSDRPSYNLSYREAGSTRYSSSGSSPNSTLITRGGRPVEELQPQLWLASRAPLRGREGNDGQGVNDGGSYPESKIGSDESCLSQNQANH